MLNRLNLNVIVPLFDGRSVQFNDARLVFKLQVLASATDEKRVRFRNHGKDDSLHKRTDSTREIIGALLNLH